MHPLLREFLCKRQTKSKEEEEEEGDEQEDQEDFKYLTPVALCH